MSVELHVLVEKTTLPDRTRWQAAIDDLGFPVLLDLELKVPEHSGFVPCKLRNNDSGFELYVDEAGSFVAEYPTASGAAGLRDLVVSFRWGGDLAECACSMAAAAALVRGFDGIAYYPEDDMLYTLDGLKEEVQQCLSEC